MVCSFLLYLPEEITKLRRRKDDEKDIVTHICAFKQFLKQKDFVKSFAEEIGISPAIVVGRLQHEKLLPHSHMNDLRRQFELT